MLSALALLTVVGSLVLGLRTASVSHRLLSMSTTTAATLFLFFELVRLHVEVRRSTEAHARLVTKWRHDADHDRLTMLLNRHGMTRAIRETGAPAAVVLLQMTGLQDVNDALGHEAGDALLRTTARRLHELVRADSPTGRVDDDVFCVLLPRCGVDEALAVAERLLQRLAEPVELNGMPVASGTVVGIAVDTGTGDVIRHAEIALRSARRGDGDVRVHEQGMQPPNARRLGIAAELRQVLANPVLTHQVLPFYQPKADLRTGRINGVEALVRWDHPERGLILPAEFIPAVESTGLVRPLTLHVLDRALADAARWAETGSPLAVAVNLSARSLRDPRLVGDVTALLHQHRVSAELLTLEITESAVMDNPLRAGDVLDGLAQLGVRLSVDDFGTGYSSLAYLARLPVTEVKVDRSFVSRMTSDHRDNAVVRSIVDLGHSLNLRVVAEGVEDEACLEALVQLGVDVAQGFLLTRPLPVTDLERWLVRNPRRHVPRLAATQRAVR